MLIHCVLGQRLGLDDVVVVLVHLFQLGGLHEELQHKQDHQLQFGGLHEELQHKIISCGWVAFMKSYSTNKIISRSVLHKITIYHLSKYTDFTPNAMAWWLAAEYSSDHDFHRATQITGNNNPVIRGQ